MQKELDRLAKEGIQWLISEPWGAVGINEYDGMCFIHCRIYQWSAKNRRLCDVHWARIIEKIRALGYREIYACLDDGNRVKAHFFRIFGFRESIGHGSGHNLMKQEI